MIVLVPHRAVLQSAVLRAGHFLHHPVDPALDDGQIAFVLGFLVQAGQRQHGSHGVHVAVGLLLPGQHVVVPAGQIIQDFFVPALLVSLIDAVQRHARGPFPVVHGQMAAGGVVAVGPLQHAQDTVCGITIVLTHRIITCLIVIMELLALTLYICSRCVVNIYLKISHIFLLCALAVLGRIGYNDSAYIMLVPIFFCRMVREVSHEQRERDDL